MYLYSGKYSLDQHLHDPFLLMQDRKSLVRTLIFTCAIIFGLLAPKFLGYTQAAVEPGN